jgi:hypothetical protein
MTPEMIRVNTQPGEDGRGWRAGVAGAQGREVKRGIRGNSHREAHARGGAGTRPSAAAPPPARPPANILASSFHLTASLRPSVRPTPVVEPGGAGRRGEGVVCGAWGVGRGACGADCGGRRRQDGRAPQAVAGAERSAHRRASGWWTGGCRRRSQRRSLRSKGGARPGGGGGQPGLSQVGAQHGRFHKKPASPAVRPAVRLPLPPPCQRAPSAVVVSIVKPRLGVMQVILTPSTRMMRHPHVARPTTMPVLPMPPSIQGSTALFLLICCRGRGGV